MAKVQGLLKGATGKLGGSTLYNSNGNTIIREAKSSIKDPQTFAQMIQRVIAKTAMLQYSALQMLANHSFQGVTMGSKCMAKFLSINMNYFRERAAQIQQAGGSIYSFYQFAQVGAVKFTPAAVILSTGKLPTVNASIEAGGQYAYFPIAGGNTYGDIIKALNLKRGDQLTFVTVEKNIATGDYTPRYSRVILDPRTNNGSAAPLTTEFVSAAVVASPNFRNQGSFALIECSSHTVKFNIGGGYIAAAGVIVSRKAKSGWLRSYCKLVLNESVIGSDLLSLGYAADLSTSTTDIYTDSAEYLNNAGVGGPVGKAQSPVAITPVVSNIVSINGIEQDVSGGNVSVDDLTSIVVTGIGLEGLHLEVLEEGSSEAVAFISNPDDTQATWTRSGGVTPNQDLNYFVKRDGEVWFTITLRGYIQGLE